MVTKLVKDFERLEDLQCKGLKLIQNPKWFCFGIDAVLLANFCKIKKDHVVVDLGTGTGIIPLIISAKTQAKKIIGVEIQENVAEMAKRSVEYNGLLGKIEILNKDLKQLKEVLPAYSVDVVVSNPPYMNSGAGLVNPEDVKAISRHEIKANLEDVIKSAYELLKDGGSFYLVHRPSRIVDIVYLCRKYRLEPKLVRFVHPDHKTKPNILLLHCVKYGKPELKFLDPLYVYKEDRSDYTDEIHEIYNS